MVAGHHSMVMDTTSGQRPAAGGAGPAADARKAAGIRPSSHFGWSSMSLAHLHAVIRWLRLDACHLRKGTHVPDGHQTKCRCRLRCARAQLLQVYAVNE